MPGKVYLFNNYNETASALRIDGNNAGSVPGWSKDESSKFTPSSIAVDRSKYKSESTATFAIGDNEVEIQWSSFLGRTSVAIPDPKDSTISLEDDLILYVAQNTAFLMTTRGFVIATFEVQKPRLMAADEVDDEKNLADDAKDLIQGIGRRLRGDE